MALWLAMLPACARKGAPTGGPPDLIRPQIVDVQPDSGGAGVPRDSRFTLTFSEGMEPRTAGEAVSIAPPIEIAQRRWKGSALTVVFGDSLAAQRTYTLFVSPTARDRHGNPLDRGYAFVFTTAESLPKGVLEGKLEARGFAAPGTYLWCYDANRLGVPDSTGGDFDALGFVDPDGNFRVVGLPVPGRYRLWAFADLDRNRSFEPERDVLAAADSVIELTAEEPVRSGLALVVLNPRAPAKVTAEVIDTLQMEQGIRWVRATPADSTLSERLEGVTGKEVVLSLPAGVWRIRVFRDFDRDRKWNEVLEPASDELELTLRPAEELKGLTLVLRRRSAP
ncbi:MAG: Ig-like domain-containing protein [Candidatus Eisenbacteria bacterium]|uniref:Ig-like domain-containing protein n=1 Tax=Eiseniibacteriota bacterium TaxID=2212470 RepID=A0A849SIJ9_UNCEI|nr:Ig-like domain-containing protein [Candidatus Eisenbacteria bacterium]